MYLICARSPVPDRSRPDGFPIWRTVTTIDGVARSVLCTRLDTMTFGGAQREIQAAATRLGIAVSSLVAVALSVDPGDPSDFPGHKALEATRAAAHNDFLTAHRARVNSHRADHDAAFQAGMLATLARKPSDPMQRRAWIDSFKAWAAAALDQLERA